MISRLMAEVLDEEGTASNADISGFYVAGKSGTTQKNIDSRYSKKHHVASFSGFFPVGNPRLLITVMVDKAQLGSRVAYGGLVAGPASSISVSNSFIIWELNRLQTMHKWLLGKESDMQELLS